MDSLQFRKQLFFWEPFLRFPVVAVKETLYIAKANYCIIYLILIMIDIIISISEINNITDYSYNTKPVRIFRSQGPINSFMYKNHEVFRILMFLFSVIEIILSPPVQSLHRTIVFAARLSLLLLLQ